jgi:hypothetical protein
MSRRSLQYRDSYSRTGKEVLEQVILSRHSFARSEGRTQLYIEASGRHVPGIPSRIQASMPIKPAKAARLAASLRRYF